MRVLREFGYKPERRNNHQPWAWVAEAKWGKP